MYVFLEKITMYLCFMKEWRSRWQPLWWISIPPGWERITNRLWWRCISWSPTTCSPTPRPPPTPPCTSPCSLPWTSTSSKSNIKKVKLCFAFIWENNAFNRFNVRIKSRYKHVYLQKLRVASRKIFFLTTKMSRKSTFVKINLML